MTNVQSKNRDYVKKLTVTAVLAAISTLLMFFEFSLPVFPSFLKFDFSDLPALIAAFVVSPIAAVAVALIKNVVHLVTSQSGGVGEIANFIVAAALVLPAGYIYRIKKSNSMALLGLITGTFSMALVGGTVNYFVMLPFYSAVMNFPLNAIIKSCSEIIPFIDSKLDVVLYTFVPFNLLKGAVLSIITIPIYTYLPSAVKLMFGKK